MPRVEFPDRADTVGISKENRGNGRLYKTYFPNHDENVVSMLAKVTIGPEGKEEMMTVDGMGGITVIDIDPLSKNFYKNRTLELFDGKQLSVTCSDFNSFKKKLYLGTTVGSVWETDMDAVNELRIKHTDEVTAIVSIHTTVFTAGKDRIVHMYNIEQEVIIASVSSEFDIRFLHMFNSIRGCPVAIADSSGCVSVWSPRKLTSKTAKSVQNVCNLNEDLIALFQSTVLGRTAMICVTSRWIRIWSIAIDLEGVEVLSILNDEIFSLMRSIESPDRVTFTTGCELKSDIPSILTGCSDGKIIQWDPVFGVKVRQYIVTSKPTAYTLYVPSQKIIVSCDVSNTMCVIDPYSKPCVNQIGPVSGAEVTCAAACEVSRIVIVVGDAEGRVFKFDGANISSSVQVQGGKYRVTALEVMVTKVNKNVVVIVGYSNGLLETYIFNDKDDSKNHLFSSASKIQSHAYSSPVTFIRNADDDKVITASEMGGTILWNLTDAGQSPFFEKVMALGNCSNLKSIGINPRNDIFVLGSATGALMLWDTKNWKELSRIKDAHEKDSIQSIGFMYDPKKLCRYIVSVGTSDQIVKCWKMKGKSLTLENTIELPPVCERAEVWGREESSLLFVQTRTGLLYVVDILMNSSGPLRFFSTDETSRSFWSVCGTHTALFVDIDDTTGKLNIWNNDLTVAESSRGRVTDMFNECCVDSHRVSPALDSVIRSHPLFPKFLLEVNPYNNHQTLFSKAILGRFPHFVTKYLPIVPEAVAQECIFRGNKRSLLWLALKMRDFESVECIVDIWIDHFLRESDCIEENSFSVADMMNDLKILSRELPAKFAELVSRLNIPKNHSINTFQCHSRFIRHGEYWMRGSALRTARGFWSHVEHRAYPDLATRRLEPEEEVYLYHLEMPHSSSKLQMPFSASVESSDRKAHPSIRYAGDDVSPESMIVLDAWDQDDLIRLGKINRKKVAPHQERGAMVQAYIHPIPFAAAGTEFLRLCHRCASDTGRNDVMSTPAVTTVLDYKWHTYFKDLHHAALFHYAFVLMLFTFHSIYFDHMMDSPAITGLPVLAFVAALFLIISFLLLLGSELITAIAGYLDPTRKMWFCVGVMAYVVAITGLSIQLRAAAYELHMNSSFTGRSVLSVATLLLYFKFLNYLTPVDFIGPLVYRVLFTISATIHYFIIVLLAIGAFATCFNLQQRRKYIDDPVDSFYGSLIQTLFFATGGIDLSVIEDADSPLFTSVFFLAFVLFVILIFLIILISATTEAFNCAYARSVGAWRAEQARIILQKSYLLPDDENLKPFHNPKWLHILAPVGVVTAFKGENIEDDDVVTGNPRLYSNGGSCCDSACECDRPVDINGPNAKFISKEIDDIQDMLSELNNRIASNKCIDVNVLADQLGALLKDSLGSKRSPRLSPRLPPGSPPKRFMTPANKAPPPTDEGSDDDAPSPVRHYPIENNSPSKNNHSSIRIRSIKSSKKQLGRQISSISSHNSDSDNEEKVKPFNKARISK